MAGIKTVVVVGDLVTDHYLKKNKRLPNSYVEVLQSTVSHAVAGGAWFLAKLIGLACKPVSGISISGPTKAQEGWAAQAHSIWADVRRSKEQPKVFVSRIVDFVGCSRPDPPKKDFPETVGRADLLVIEDLQLGFDDDERRWPKPLRTGGFRGGILLKVNAPPRESRLWKQLLEEHADRLTVMISVNSLRARGAAISKGLSWDQTIEELAGEFRSGPSAYDLARCRRTIVYFPDGSAAASFTRCRFKLGPTKKGQAADALVRPLAELERFVYLANEVEGTFLASREGKLFGMGSIVTAAAVHHELDPDHYPQYIALGRALAAGRHMFDIGGVGDEPKTEIDIQGIEERLAFVIPDKDSRPTAPKTDPAFEYSTAYPHEVLSDGRMQQAATKSDLLRDVAGPTVEYMKAKAFEIVMEGAEHALRAVPKASYAKYQTVDREEIERINAVRALIEEYRNNPNDKRPLSIAVFGQPGSGKSFAIKQLGELLFGKENPTLEFNLSQFPPDKLELLHQAFHRVRDASIKGTIPLVFWDEFDADGLRWLRHFLAPMQDAEFRVGSDVHCFGKAIFVFAGGTKSTFETFDRSDSADVKEKESFAEFKGPDFISRLRGHIDIKGPNPADDRPEKDPAYVIRRAIILRSTLEQMYGHLIDEPSKRAHVDAAIVQGFLNARQFVHGARSIQALLAMCRLQGASRFDVSRLNAPNLLTMHVTKDFFEHVQESAFDTELIEGISEALQEGYFKVRTDQKWMHGQKYDPALRTDPNLLPYGKLGEAGKERNRAAARVMVAKLDDVGYRLARQAVLKAIPVAPLPAGICKKLAVHEHDRWLREKLIQGFEYAAAKNDDLRQNCDIAPFDSLGADEKRLDFVIAEKLPALLKKRHVALERGKRRIDAY